MSALLNYKFSISNMDVKPIVWLFKDSNQESNFEKKTSAANLESLFKQFQHLFANEVREKAVVFWLNDDREVIGFEVISIGDLNTSIVHPREVFRGAIVIDSKDIIFAHNHPSGSFNPSREDLKITSRMKEAGEIIGVTLHDSVIFTNDGCRSIMTNKLYEKNNENLKEEKSGGNDKIKSLEVKSNQKKTKQIKKINIVSASLLSQFRKIKHDEPGAILLFKVGDCYQTFEEDARTISKALCTNLTTRSNGESSKVLLTEFPIIKIDQYISILVKAGLRVAICENK